MDHHEEDIGRALREINSAMELIYQAVREIVDDNHQLPPIAIGVALINCGARYSMEYDTPESVSRYLIGIATRIEHGGDDVRH